MAEARVLEKELAGAPGLLALPYNYRPELVEPPRPEAQADTPLIEAEKAELEAIAEAALAANHKTRFKKPAVFETKLKNATGFIPPCMDGYELEVDEINFMENYEAGREYLECAKPRYDQLRAVFGPLPRLRRQ